MSILDVYELAYTLYYNKVRNIVPHFIQNQYPYKKSYSIF